MPPIDEYRYFHSIFVQVEHTEYSFGSTRGIMLHHIYILVPQYLPVFVASRLSSLNLPSCRVATGNWASPIKLLHFLGLPWSDSQWISISAPACLRALRQRVLWKILCNALEIHQLSKTNGPWIWSTSVSKLVVETSKICARNALVRWEQSGSQSVGSP